MRFSIVVITYNPDKYKLRLTLKSILEQSYKNYEIVVSDDGSEENHFDYIEEIFEEYNFSDYTLVPHEENQGTVKNLIDAFAHSTGDYIRDFGPGDTFYSKDTLRMLNVFLEKKKCDICFGLLKGYQIKDGELLVRDFCHPFDIQAYRKKEARDRKIKNLVLYGDNPSGASLCVKREVFEDYLIKISKYVKYEEDIFVVLAALDGIDIELFDRYLVWYEMNIGVSTGGSSKFTELLLKDVVNFFNMIFETYPDNKYVKKRKVVSPFFKIKNLYLRTLARMFVNPGAVPYLFVTYIERIMGMHKDKKSGEGFMNDSSFRED
ncbi:MAG: glycosyltransferase [Lachnospiraceae bacterium]|nr:glycosyltransferase [Lachnospiraceae bacterium]